MLGALHSLVVVVTGVPAKTDFKDIDGATPLVHEGRYVLVGKAHWDREAEEVRPEFVPHFLVDVWEEPFRDPAPLRGNDLILGLSRIHIDGGIFERGFV